MLFGNGYRYYRANRLPASQTAPRRPHSTGSGLRALHLTHTARLGTLDMGGYHHNQAHQPALPSRANSEGPRFVLYMFAALSVLLVLGLAATVVGSKYLSHSVMSEVSGASSVGAKTANVVGSVTAHNINQMLCILAISKCFNKHIFLMSWMHLTCFAFSLWYYHARQFRCALPHHVLPPSAAAGRSPHQPIMLCVTDGIQRFS